MLKQSARMMFLLGALTAPLAWGQNSPDADEVQDGEAAEAEFDDEFAATEHDQEDTAPEDSDDQDSDASDVESPDIDNDQEDASTGTDTIDDNEADPMPESEDLDAAESDESDGPEAAAQDEPSGAFGDEEAPDESDPAAEPADEAGDSVAADDSVGMDDSTEADNLSDPSEAPATSPAASDAPPSADPPPPASPPAPPAPNPAPASPPLAATKLYVGNLPLDASEEQLRELFSEYGDVENVTITTDRETGRSRGFGFVTLRTGANEAIEALNGKLMGGRVLTVNLSGPRTPRPGRDRSW